jgi:hypothetical protein
MTIEVRRGSSSVSNKVGFGLLVDLEDLGEDSFFAESVFL